MQALSVRLVNRALAILLLAWGLLALASPFIGSQAPTDWASMVLGPAAVSAAIAAWTLPWQRWPRRANLVLFVLAFALIGYDNHADGPNPYSYSAFFLVAFVAIGLSQPRWTSLPMLVPAAVAYLVPLAVIGETEGLHSAFFVFPALVLAAESTAWGLERVLRAEKARRDVDDRFRALVAYAWDLMVVLDSAGVISYASPAAERILRAEPEALIGREICSMVHPDDLSAAIRVRHEAMTHPGEVRHIEVRLRCGGTWRWTEISLRDLRDVESVRGFVLNIGDVHERKEATHRLALQARHDQLTGLCNRRAALDRLEELLSTAREGTLSVLYLDLDGFKPVNDAYGHGTGDELLRRVAERLRAEVDDGDLVARVGGDEFVVVHESRGDASTVRRLADRLVDRFTEPFHLPSASVQVHVSIGVAHHEPGVDVDELLRRADTMMYRAKRDGGRRSVVPRREGERPGTLGAPGLPFADPQPPVAALPAASG